MQSTNAQIASLSTKMDDMHAEKPTLTEQLQDNWVLLTLAGTVATGLGTKGVVKHLKNGGE